MNESIQPPVRNEFLTNRRASMALALIIGWVILLCLGQSAASAQNDSRTLQRQSADTLTRIKNIPDRTFKKESGIYKIPAMKLPEKDLWALPFKGEDFRDDERVHWGRDIHSNSGVQKHGYDLDIMRYNSEAKQWDQYSDAGENNEDWYVYGKPVYAMEDGKVIACWRNAPENLKRGMGEGNWHPELTKYEDNKTRIYGGGNGLWIEHADGSRVEYAHFQPGTVPASLCPHNETLLPAIIDSPTVSNAWSYIRVSPEQQQTVKKGQKIGLVGNTGTSSNPHLHIHREEGGTANATKSGGSPVEMKFSSGLWIPLDHSKDPYVEWESFAGKPIPPGKSLIWPSRTTVAEHARHGYPVEQFGALFQHLTDSGMWAEWMDFYTVGGSTYVNHIWRPAKAGWRAYFGLDGSAFQNTFDTNAEEKFSPVFIDSYKSGGQTRYVAIFVHNKPGGFLARHGITSNELSAAMNKAVEEGLAAVNVSAVSHNSNLRYTVLFRDQNYSGWTVKPHIPESQYQSEYNKETQAGRKPVYLNAYMHAGQPYLSAVFANIQTNGRKDRHKMSAGTYQAEYESALSSGMLTRTVTSFDGAQSQHRFASTWWK